MPQQKNTGGYLIQLDGVRFIAIFMVMVAHWLQWQIDNPLINPIQFVHGVTLFFVLSGFLISRILIENRDRYDLASLNRMGLVRQFYIRRFLRIFPIYYLTIFLLAIVNFPDARTYFPWLVTYTSNIYQSITTQYVGKFNHFWSLAVEEQFYLFWPWLMLFVNGKYLIHVIFSAIGISLLTKVVLYVQFEPYWMAGSYFTLSCMHALGLGALLAWLTIKKDPILDKLAHGAVVWSAIVIYVSAMYLFIKYPAWKALGDEFLFSVMAMLVINRAIKGRFRWGVKAFLVHPWVNYFGKVSYGMYVYHLFMTDLAYYIFPRIGLQITNKYTFFVALFILTFIVSHFSWRLIESPINGLKDKFPYVRPRSQSF